MQTLARISDVVLVGVAVLLAAGVTVFALGYNPAPNSLGMLAVKTFIRCMVTLAFALPFAVILYGGWLLYGIIRRRKPISRLLRCGASFIVAVPMLPFKVVHLDATKWTGWLPIYVAMSIAATEGIFDKRYSKQRFVVVLLVLILLLALTYRLLVV